MKLATALDFPEQDVSRIRSRVDRLVLFHFCKNKLESKTAETSFLNDNAFGVESCLRKFWITEDEAALGFRAGQGLQVFKGTHAYEFLLSIALGLESEMIGETDIFGQIKEAWAHRTLTPALENFLQPLMQYLFADAKEIRTEYVQRIGGSSYGSIVRKIIREEKRPGVKSKILLIGAGQLAKTITPWLLNDEFCDELWMLNRTKAKAEELKLEYSDVKHSPRVLTFDASVEAELIEQADDIVYCVPFDEKIDRERVERLKKIQSLKPGVKIIHLGGKRLQAKFWEELSNLHMLDEIFEIQRNVSDARVEQITKAREACLARARLRGLGGSLSIAHGWEDLALFL